MLSLGATFAPILLGVGFDVIEGFGPVLLTVTGSVALGPSVGHWYAEQYSRGLLTAGLRAVLMLVALVSFNASYS